MLAYVVTAAVAMLVAFGSTPLVRRLARRFDIIAVPSDRKIHLDPTPQAGGAAILLGVLAAFGVSLAFPHLRALFEGSRELIGVAAAATVVTILGVVDDRRELQPTTKLAGQVVAGGILVLGGVEVVYFWFPGLGVVALGADLSALITIVWTIAVINAVNLIDGLDGLAAGIVTIASASLLVYAVSSSPGEATPAELLMLVLAAACIGFLPHNFYPASIFMGDAGSMLLGLLLASGTVLGFSRTDEPRFVDVAGFVVPVLLPVLVLAIPLADAVFAVFRRVRGGKSVFHGDKEHLHHRLFDLAQNHRTAVGVIYLWSALVASATVSLAVLPGMPGRVTAGAFAGTLAISAVIIPLRLRRGAPLEKNFTNSDPEEAQSASD